MTTMGNFPNCIKCHASLLAVERDGLVLEERVGVQPLLGDCFFKYTCSSCSTTGQPLFERLPMSWINIIQLVLYHLHKNDKNRVGFFRWKEDICRLIEERWELLCPLKSRTASWMNSVSSVLSANSLVFESGFEKLKQPGWWALKNIQPPRPTTAVNTDNTTTATAATTTTNTNTIDKDSKLSTKKLEDEMLDVGQEVSPSKIVDSPKVAKVVKATVLESAQTILFNKSHVDRIPNVNALLPLEREATPTTMKAAQEIKRKLVERLLKVDSKLLQEALASAPVPPFLSTPSPPPPPLITTHSQSPSPSPSQFHSDTSKSSIAANSFDIITCSTTSSSMYGMVESFDRKNILDVKNSAKSKLSTTLKELRKIQKAVKPANYVRASPHENELLETCLRISNPDFILNRFKRKLIMRRAKRRIGLPIFDIDALMYQYLKSNEPLSLPDSKLTKSNDNDTDGDTPELKKNKKKSIESNSLFEIPFHRDPFLSFRTKLIGVSNVTKEYPLEIISPYSGLRLPGFIHRDYDCKPLKLLLMEELKQLAAPPLPYTQDTLKVGAPIDFIHLRKEWVPQVNRLLRKFFWPTVDITENLDSPDYGVLVMYQKLIIGCAFMTPDGYITYFLIHPEWAGSGLGSKLLYLLLTRVAPKHLDVTLHVSVTNPALLLYQKFGFKPEEFIVNFYDKYFHEDVETVSVMQTFSKNAFFIRYRR